MRRGERLQPRGLGIGVHQQRVTDAVQHWEARTNHDGIVYYFNTHTQQTSWLAPHGMQTTAGTSVAPGQLAITPASTDSDGLLARAST